MGVTTWGGYSLGDWVVITGELTRPSGLRDRGPKCITTQIVVIDETDDMYPVGVLPWDPPDDLLDDPGDWGLTWLDQPMPCGWPRLVGPEGALTKFLGTGSYGIRGATPEEIAQAKTAMGCTL
jgi:hypothetical protein